MWLNHEYKKQPTSDFGLGSWYRRGYAHEIFFGSCTDKEYTETTLQKERLMTNMTKKGRGDWLAKWLIILRFMDLGRPMVSRRSTSVYACVHQRCPQTLATVCRNISTCDVFTTMATRENISEFHLFGSFANYLIGWAAPCICRRTADEVGCKHNSSLDCGSLQAE